MKYHSQTISDVLSLIDFPQETSLGRVIDLHVIEGRIPSLVRMVEAGVLCQGALVSLVSLDVLLVPLGGASAHPGRGHLHRHLPGVREPGRDGGLRRGDRPLRVLPHHQGA